MTHTTPPVLIQDVANYLALEANPRSNMEAESMSYRCPLCDTNGRKYRLNVNRRKNLWNCFSCGNGGGCIDLYRFITHTALPNAEAFKELMRGMAGESGGQYVPQARPDTEYENNAIQTADDEHCHQAYSELMELPYFRLSDEHKEHLMQVRHLSEEDIIAFGFRTFPKSSVICGKSEYADRTRDYYLAHKKEISNNSKLSEAEAIAGIIIAYMLRQKGISLKAVPGFYHITPDAWGFNYRDYNTGIVIPTKNEKGQMVPFQIRLDNPEAKYRYCTISSKGLPDGATEKIARAHYAYMGAEPDWNAPILLTEGALKADVILALSKKDGKTVMAIPGVGHKELVRTELRHLKEHGVTTVYECFDIDKCTNIHVQKSVKIIKDIFREEGIRLVSQFWDEETAEERLEAFRKECTSHSILLPESSGSPFRDLQWCLYELNRAGIDTKAMDHWKKETKGLDDWLISQKSAES